MKSVQSAALLLTLAFALDRSLVDAQEVNGNRVRYDLSRATVLFEAGSFTPEEMGRFAVLADRGVQDIDTLLNHAGPGARTGPPIIFVVRDGLSMSRTYRRTIMLPAER